ncbi:hypothetical protein AOLI_G00070350 [Acnodon oligacanthus]
MCAIDSIEYRHFAYEPTTSMCGMEHPCIALLQRARTFQHCFKIQNLTESQRVGLTSPLRLLLLEFKTSSHSFDGLNRIDSYNRPLITTNRTTICCRQLKQGDDALTSQSQTLRSDQVKRTWHP